MIISFSKQYEYCTRIVSHLEHLECWEKNRAEKEGLVSSEVIAIKKLAEVKKQLKTIVDEYDIKYIERED